MKALGICPSTLQSGFSTYSPIARKLLFDGKNVSHIIKIPKPTDSPAGAKEALKNVGRISLSGAQPKFSLVVDDAGNLRYAKQEEQGEYILKPAPVGYHIINRDYCAANENLTMQIASQVYGIETAPNAVCFFESDGAMAYLTRRFDINGNKKYPQEDFAALMGFSKDMNGSDYKYSKGSYEECGAIIRKYVKAYMPDLRRFFRVVVFNFLTLNDDAHLKNFSLIERDGEYRLSPAYDLLNTSLQIYEPRIFALDKGLFKEGMALTDTRWVKKEDFLEFGKRIGLPLRVINRDLDMFLTQQPLAFQLIDHSFLSEELKENYRQSFDYRRKMLTF